jgi:hypothetical protein
MLAVIAGAAIVRAAPAAPVARAALTLRVAADLYYPKLAVIRWAVAYSVTILVNI